MKVAHLRKMIIIATFAVFGVVIVSKTVQRVKFWYFTTEKQITAIAEAEAEHQKKVLARKTATIERNDNAVFYLTTAAAGCILLTVVLVPIILSTGKHRAIVRNASVFFAELGEGYKIPVLLKDLSRITPACMALAGAKVLREQNAGNAEALEYIREATDISLNIAKAQAPLRSAMQAALPAQDAAALPGVATPTFADLLHSEQLAPGKPLILGYHYGLPEYRDIHVLKSLAVSGLQGSGKTLSMGYLIASAALCASARVYVVDPHKGHEKGLYQLIQPLERSGRVQFANPFNVAKLIQQLNETLDRRLRGDESSEEGILLVIDELARLAKVECFDELITFLERCTEETRKANITFIGGSQKWTARHFKGRADIRACMNSALVHRTKPSQAELLLEDSEEKRMVKQLKRPGEAILVTDFADARLVQMPFCTRRDMDVVAQKIGNAASAIAVISPHEITEGDPMISPENQAKSEEIDTHPLTPELLTELLETGGWAQHEVARQTGVNQSKISKLKNGNTKIMSPEEKDLILDFLISDDQKTEEITNEKSTKSLKSENRSLEPAMDFAI